MSEDVTLVHLQQTRPTLSLLFVTELLQCMKTFKESESHSQNGPVLIGNCPRKCGLFILKAQRH